VLVLHESRERTVAVIGSPSCLVFSDWLMIATMPVRRN
jgi:hypothetical protein